MSECGACLSVVCVYECGMCLSVVCVCALMWLHLRGHWELYTPYTNVLWINYLVRKIQTKGRLRRISTKKFTEKIVQYANNTARFKSAQETFKYLHDNGKLFMAAKKPQRTKR